MDAEQNENGAQWMRSVLHCTACRGRCGLPHCGTVRGMLLEMHTTPPHASAGAQLLPLRELQAHWLECKDAACALCAPLSAQLTGRAVEEEDFEDNSGWGDSDDLDAAEMHSNEEARLSSPASSNASEAVPMFTAGPAPLTACAPACSTLAHSFVPVASMACDDQLVLFAHFLLHSFLRWSGSLEDSGLDAAELDCMQRGRALWTHVIRDCPRAEHACAHPGCMQARLVIAHMLACQDGACRVCSAVKGQFNAAAYEEDAPQLSSAAHRMAADMPAWMQGCEGALRGLRL